MNNYNQKNDINEKKRLVPMPWNYSIVTREIESSLEIVGLFHLFRVLNASNLVGLK